MTAKENKMSEKQLLFLIIQTQVGVGILSLPHKIAIISKQDGWISTFIAGMLIQIFIFILWGLSKRFPSFTLFDILVQLLGKGLGKIVIISYVIYYVFQGSLVLAQYSQIIENWILQRTPSWITILLMVVTVVYVAKDGLRSIARFYVLVTPLLIVFFILITYALKDANFLYILPIGQTGISTIFKGSREAAFSFIGFEIFLFLYPYVQTTDNRKLKIITVAHTLTTLFYTYLVFASLAYFESTKDIKLAPEPLLVMIKAYSFRIIERTDLFFLSIWIISVATSLITVLFVASKGLAHLFEHKNHATVLPYVAGMTFFIALIPNSEQTLDKINEYFSPLIYIFVLFIPASLLMLSLLLRKREVGVNKE
ncbi:spore germination protein [Peribacillus frigoritolerans]|uniref:GerAB/ArcD/ProY family transporter n=1 Tax=Peribacillus frigoritolerans TaxID=450367 RepID=UPI00222671C4|nr:spore germination protein [Peribacillus frigoritolerans]UYY96939.1 spore germination protein [Peribacillus frigoritolerans]